MGMLVARLQVGELLGLVGEAISLRATNLDGACGAHEVLVVRALETLAGTDLAIGRRQAAAGVEFDEGAAGGLRVAATDGDGECGAAVVVEGAGRGGTGLDGGFHDDSPFVRDHV